MVSPAGAASALAVTVIVDFETLGQDVGFAFRAGGLFDGDSRFPRRTFGGRRCLCGAVRRGHQLRVTEEEVARRCEAMKQRWPSMSRLSKRPSLDPAVVFLGREMFDGFFQLVEKLLSV